MLRGSRPGERRGGRKRGTPHRRTILRDRILSIGLDHPAASQRAFLVKLVKDRKLPADTRMAVAPKCFPPKRTRSLRTGRPRALGGSRTTIAQEALATVGSAVASKGSPAVVPAIRDWTPQALDALFGVVQDATANPKARSKAALKIAEFLLPKAGKKAKVIPDEYGFSINPNLAGAYRDIRLELLQSTHKIPAIAAKIKKLEARSALEGAHSCEPEHYLPKTPTPSSFAPGGAPGRHPPPECACSCRVHLPLNDHRERECKGRALTRLRLDPNPSAYKEK